MPRVRPLEVKALVPLLEQDWESPEDLAEALILQLEHTRASRTDYVAVMEFGTAPNHMYVGIGPYPGAATARAAMKKHPAAGEAGRRAVVPMLSDQGLQNLLSNIDTPPERRVTKQAREDEEKEWKRKLRLIFAKERRHVAAGSWNGRGGAEVTYLGTVRELQEKAGKDA